MNFPASWMPGAKEFVFQGHEGEAPRRGYKVSIDGGAAGPLTNQKDTQFWNRSRPTVNLCCRRQAPV